ncbi:glycosyltransferase family 2 protein [bacterium]|nr:glycosyltransferase family 2 protein [bacterium]
MLNPEFAMSPLFIYCDGARNEAEAVQVEETRKLVRDWPHPNKTIIERDQNFGLANSIISGVTEQCNAQGRVIVLEDDMVVSPFFLNYMNAALVKYQDDKRVISIHGYSFPINGLPEAFFLKGTSCWGWATWKRGWDLFEPDGKKLHDELLKRKLMHRFNIYSSYPYQRMLLDQIHGRNDSWAVRWYASALIHDKLTLHPGKSLVYNTGMDGSGTHCDQYDGFASSLSTTPISFNGLVVSENVQVLQAWNVFMKAVRREKIFKNIFSFKRLFKFIFKRLRIC